MKLFLALIKREVMEHSNLVRVPLVLIGLAVLIRLSLVFGNVTLNLNLPDFLRLDSTVSALTDNAIAQGLNFLNSLVVFVMFVVAVFYALTCLFNERQDQSVLFWRSLPVSDTLTVGSKLAVALVLIPIIIVVCQAIISLLFLGTASVSYLSNYFAHSLGSLSRVLLWSMLPTIAWCLFCSEIAKKSPFLLAIIAPILLVVVDWFFFDGAIANVVVVNRVFGFSDYTLTPLLVGLILSGVFIVLSIIRRSQRI